MRDETRRLELLRQAATDLTALALSVDVLERRHPRDESARRAVALVEHLHEVVIELTGELHG